MGETHFSHPPSPYFLRRYQSFTLLEDLQDSEVDPVEAGRVGDAGEEGVADGFGWVVEVAPPLFVGGVAVLEADRGEEGIHWPDLDEDVRVANLLLGKASGESQRSLKRWLEGRGKA